MMLELHKGMSFTEIIIFTLMYSYTRSYLYELQLRLAEYLLTQSPWKLLKVLYKNKENNNDCPKVV